MVIVYIIELVILVIAITLSALFSSAEMALFSLNRAKILSYKNVQDPAKNRIWLLMDNAHLTLVTIILGNMFVNSCVSMLNDELLNALHLNEAATTALSILIGTAILLFFGEITPMTLANAHADAWAKQIASPLWQFRRVISPLVRTIGVFCDWILDKLGRREPVPLTSDEYLSYLDTCVAAHAFTKKEAAILKQTFELRDTQLGEVMRPRVDLTCAAYSDPPELVAEKIRRSGQAYLPVGHRDLDSADALLDSLDFFRLNAEERKSWNTSPALLRNVPFLPKQTKLNKALRTMRAKGVSATLIADEYGGVNGMISIQDIYSEVAGQSVELSKVENQDYEQLAPDTWRFDGGCPLDSVRDNSDWKNCNADDEYKSSTISGLFCEELGYLPEPGEQIRIGEYRLTALDVSKNRITEVLLKRDGGKEAS